MKLYRKYFSASAPKAGFMIIQCVIKLKANPLELNPFVDIKQW